MVFVKFRCRIQLQVNFVVPGVAGPEAVLRPNVQAGGGGNHHKHHGGQNTDGGKARTVALHPVGHGGYGYKVVFLVVVFFVLLQASAQGYRAGNEQQVGCYDHQNYQKEENAHRHTGIFNGCGEVVGDPQHHNPCKGKKPIPFWRLFSHGFAFQQGQRVGAVHRPQGFEKQKKEDAAEHDDGVCYALSRQGDPVVHLAVHDFKKQQFGKLGKSDAHSKSQHDADDGG